MTENRERTSSGWEVLRIFLRLGLTSFGGPVAHLGYFRTEFVARRKWLDDGAYADLVALCQFLPGPASSQVGMGLGLLRAGLPGALAAWIGFTLPSALVMLLFAMGLDGLSGTAREGGLHGLKVVAVAVVAQAVWGMAKSLCPDRNRASVAILTAMVGVAWPSPWGQILAIVAGGWLGWRLFPVQAANAGAPLLSHRSRRNGVLFLALFFLLLALLPLLAATLALPWLLILDSFYRSGALVFGGGHVVLPLLQAELVSTGWIDASRFLAGYGAVQAVPGPLFTFAAYLGAAMPFGPSGWVGGVLALCAVFLPSFLLIAGTLPFWDAMRGHPGAQSVMGGVNAAVVGLLIAAFYHPVWTGGILSAGDFILALGVWGGLQYWRLPPWLAVVLCGGIGWGLAL